VSARSSHTHSRAAENKSKADDGGKRWDGKEGKKALAQGTKETKADVDGGKKTTDPGAENRSDVW